jgi:hypothetical protein
MNAAKKSVLALALAGSMLGGGAVGATLFAAGTSGAQSTSTTNAPAADNANGGKFTPNEDKTHESNESAAREAQEDAGQRPTVP